MPLQRQKIEIPLAAGRDGKTDPKLVAPGRALEVINGNMDQIGAIAKRRGYDWLGSLVQTISGSLPREAPAVYPQVIRSHDDELCLVSTVDYKASDVLWRRTGFFVRHLKNGADNYWEQLGAQKYLTYKLLMAPISVINISSVCTVASEDYIILAWNYLSGVDNMFFSVYDRNSDTWIYPLNETGLVSGTNLTECLGLFVRSLNDDWAVFIGRVTGANNIFFYTIHMNEMDRTISSTFTSKFLDLDAYGGGAGAVWDAIGDTTRSSTDNKVYLAYRDTTPNLKVRKLTRSGNSAGSYTNAGVAPTAIGVTLSPDNAYLYVCYATGGTTIYIEKIDASNMSLAASGNVNLFSTIGDRVAIGVSNPQGSDIITTYAEVGAATPPRATVIMSVFDASLSIIRSESIYNTTLSSKPFSEGTVGGRQLYAVLGHQCDLQPSLQIGHLQRFDPVRGFGNAQQRDLALDARVLYNSARALLTNEATPKNVMDLGGGRYLIPIKKVNQKLADGDEEISPGLIDVQLNPVAPPVSARLGSNTYFAGGKVSQYDGARHYETGFALYPENIVLASQSATGGNLAPGVYFASLTYEFTQSDGNIVRSAPSTPIQVTVPAGPSTQRFELTVPYLNLVEDNKGWDTRIVLWRTLAGGSLYYRECDCTPNTKGLASTVSVWADEADSVVSQNATLYTTGGVLADFPPSASVFVASGPTRLFSIPVEDRAVVEFSKEIQAGISPAFNEALRFRVDRDGDNTGLAVLDGNVIIFKKRSIYLVSGAGPNDLGQGSFSSPRRIASDVGCVDANSILTTDTGVYFKSYRGFRFLTRGLQVSPTIAHEVEDLKSKTCIASVLLRSEQEARFVHSDGTVVVHNYEQNAWMRHTSATHFTGDIKDTDSLGDDMVTITENGETNSIIMRESASLFTDDDTDGTPGVSYALQIDTPWIKLSGLQGFQRVYWVGLVGEYKTAHTLTVELYYDYVETVVETITVSPAADPSPYLYRFKPSRQKCQAIRFRIADSAGAGTEENFKLTSLALEIGVKRGMPKLAAAKTL